MWSFLWYSLLSRFTLPYTHQGRSGLQGTRNNISLPPRNSSHIAGLAETQAGIILQASQLLSPGRSGLKGTRNNISLPLLCSRPATLPA
ncbi:hypothetical protein Pelo_3562 [Pelomyxa schiedti]|nr:hypothetical protein Pelo_3562 [Pelomyxa schiedti]